jgi:Flp pilus assembly protein TadG
VLDIDGEIKPMRSTSIRKRRAAGWKRGLATHSGAQISVLFALAATALVGVMALGADVGVLYYNWGQLQKAADAAALAGAGYLPNDTTTATSTATTYATKNGVLAAEIVSATPINSNKQMQVTVQRTVPYSFARVLGLTNGYVKASATASVPPGIGTVNAGPGSPVACNGVACTSGGTTLTAGSGAPGSGTPFAGSCGSSTGAYNVLPMALDNQTSWVSGSTTTLNEASSSGNGNGNIWPDAPGNWGYVNLCGNSNSSGSVLRTSMAAGYGGELSIGNYLTTVTGAKSGPVNQGLQDRSTPSQLAAPSTFDPGDPRAVVIPLVDFSKDAVTNGPCQGQCTVKITGFMAAYILSVNNGNIFVQDIGLVAPNAVGSINAPNAGAMGDIVLVH